MLAAWLQTREPKHPEHQEEIANAISNQLSRLLAGQPTVTPVVTHWFDKELSSSIKDGSELGGVKIVADNKPAKYNSIRERLMPSIELLSLAKQYPSKEILGLIDKTIQFGVSLKCDVYEMHLFGIESNVKPTLFWPSMESKEFKTTLGPWQPFILIYLNAKELKKQMSGTD